MSGRLAADGLDLDGLLVAHEREAAWCIMRARALLAEAERHRRDAFSLRSQLRGDAS